MLKVYPFLTHSCQETFIRRCILLFYTHTEKRSKIQAFEICSFCYTYYRPYPLENLETLLVFDTAFGFTREILMDSSFLGKAREKDLHF